MYLAAVPSTGGKAPALVEAQQVAEQLGYRTGPGDLGCDRGGPEAFGMTDRTATGIMADALYFKTQAEAEHVRAAFAARGLDPKVAHVTTMCRD